MTSALTKAWQELVRPFLARPRHVQVAALCYRSTGRGKEVLLITSRGTGRWILPKGWPIDGLSGSESALREAWEEAGVEADERHVSWLGQFEYDKELDSGGIVPVDAHVYLTPVLGLASRYPESGERRRKWFPVREAANLVREPGLRDILNRL